MKKLAKRNGNTFNTVEVFKRNCKCKPCLCRCKIYLLRGTTKNKDNNNTKYFTMTSF